MLGRHEQGRERAGGVLVADLAEQPGADDAAAAPDPGDGRDVDVPAVLRAGRADLLEPLGVGDDLGGPQGVADVVDELLPVRRLDTRGPGPRARRARPPRTAASPEADRAKTDSAIVDDRHAELEGGLDRPAAGALLLRGVDDDVDEGPAGGGVDVVEHLGRDLDEERVELAGVPLAEDLGDLGGGQPGRRQHVVGLRDELHVGVLDAVVDHLDEVAGAVRAHPGAARLAVHLRGDGLEDRAEGGIRLRRAAGHDRGALERADLAAGDAGADEVEAELAQAAPRGDGCRRSGRCRRRRRCRPPRGAARARR